MGGRGVEFETRELRYIFKYKGDLTSLALYQLTIPPILIASLLFQNLTTTYLQIFNKHDLAS